MNLSNTLKIVKIIREDKAGMQEGLFNCYQIKMKLDSKAPIYLDLTISSGLFGRVDEEQAKIEKPGEIILTEEITFLNSIIIYYLGIKHWEKIQRKKRKEQNKENNKRIKRYLEKKYKNIL